MEAAAAAPSTVPRASTGSTAAAAAAAAAMATATTAATAAEGAGQAGDSPPHSFARWLQLWNEPTETLLLRLGRMQLVRVSGDAPGAARAVRRDDSISCSPSGSWGRRRGGQIVSLLLVMYCVFNDMLASSVDSGLYYLVQAALSLVLFYALSTQRDTKAVSLMNIVRGARRQRRWAIRAPAHATTLPWAACRAAVPGRVHAAGHALVALLCRPVQPPQHLAPRVRPHRRAL